MKKIIAKIRVFKIIKLVDIIPVMLVKFLVIDTS